jgi:hydroxypyruvate isomerase
MRRMPRLAANLSLLFPHIEFPDRFAAAGADNACLQYDLFHMQVMEGDLAHIDRIGYRGWIGCEYNPLGDTGEGLAWARPYL